MACSGFVSYGSSTPVNDPRGTGPRTIAFDVDQLRLKRGVKNKLVVSIQAFDPETPTREATVDATGTVEMPQLTWTNPAADWSVRATSWKETRIPARGVRAIDMEFDVTVGAAPDRGELVVKAPDGARGAVGFTVVPEQSARPEAASVKIDGDLSDWSEGEFTLAKGPLGEAQTAVRWSPEGLAFAVDALDDQHFQQESTAILWRGDSIQFAISAKPNTTLGYQGKDLEFGASLTPAGPLVWCWYGGDGGKTGRVDSARVAVKREAGHTLYEVFLPSSVLRGLDLRAGNVLGFGYIVNDNDGAGYRGATEWTPGMTGTKDSSLFGDLHLR
jgi:hypothetical protein